MSGELVAILGLGCRFPGGASSPESFWALLRDGVCALTQVPPSRFDIEALYHPKRGYPGKIASRYGAFLDNIDQFDAAFFGITPRVAQLLDPQHRLLLEVAWEALEDAGIPQEVASRGQTGVYVGMMAADYGDRVFQEASDLSAHALNGMARSAASSRISNSLGLLGPAMTVDTGCSSSLTAVHLACQSLRSGECSLALAGGVQLNLRPQEGICLSRGSMLSADGRSRFGDARADGYGRGEGVGMVVLKLLRQALEDGDPIRAVIRGSVVQCFDQADGPMVRPTLSELGTTIRAAWRAAGVTGNDLQYVEAHGTGTVEGDYLELAALGEALSEGRARDLPCRVGSVKTNLGHAEGASGIAALIKLILCLQHGEVPPSLHFDTPNPRVAWESLALTIPRQLEPWPASAGPRRGAVNCYAFSGTKVHMVLEEPPPRMPASPASAWPDSPAERPFLLPVSARSPEALLELAQAYLKLLSVSLEPATPTLADLVSSAAHRRTHHPWRLVAMGQTRDQLAEALSAFVQGAPHPLLLTGKAEGGDSRKKTEPEAGATEGRQALDGERVRALAERYVSGGPLDWGVLYPPGCSWAPLPAYPWQRKRHWLDKDPTAVPGKGTIAPVRGKDATASLIPAPGPSSEPAASPRPRRTDEGWYLSPTWIETDFPLQSEHYTGDGTPTWLILADQDGHGMALKQALEQAQQAVVLAELGDAGGGSGPLDDLEPERPSPGALPKWRIDPADPQAFDTLLREALPAGSVFQGVVQLWGLTGATGRKQDHVQQARAQACSSTLQLVQALFRAGVRTPPRLYLVTQRSQAVGNAPHALSPEQAPLWGLGQTLLYEHPELQCTRVDLGLEPLATSAGLLAREVLAFSMDDEVAYRNGQRYAARLSRALPALEAPPISAPGSSLTPAASATMPTPGGTWLFVGRLAGLGRSVARWAVQRGLRDVVLLEPTDRGEASTPSLVAGLEAAGAQVSLHAVDLTCREALAQVIGPLRARKTLRGVVFLADLEEGTPLVLQDVSSLEAFLAQNTEPAWLLSELLQDTPLDVFALLASPAALLGALGQGRSAMAHAFLDALACQRRFQGLPGLSLSWGAWSEGDPAEGLEARQPRLVFPQGRSLTHEEEMPVLDFLLQPGVATARVGVIPFEIRRWVELHPQLARTSRFQHLQTDAGPAMTPTPADLALLEALNAAPAQARPAMLEQLILGQTAAVLGVDPRSIPLEAPLKGHGLDSLGGLELRSRLETVLGLTLPAGLLWGYPHVRALTQHLAQRLALLPAETASPPILCAEEKRADDQAQDLAALSDEDLLSALLEELALSSESSA